jgi:hypothetical protein
VDGFHPGGRHQIMDGFVHLLLVLRVQLRRGSHIAAILSTIYIINHDAYPNLILYRLQLT